jgi:hypothetical protein
LVDNIYEIEKHKDLTFGLGMVEHPRNSSTREVDVEHHKVEDSLGSRPFLKTNQTKRISSFEF